MSRDAALPGAPFSHALRSAQRLAFVSLAASVALAAANIAIGIRAGSTSVVAAGVEFAADVLASAVVLLGLWIAAKPADDNHPYGHGRSEMLAGVLVGMFLFVGGLGIAVGALQRLGGAHEPPHAFAIWPLVIAIVVRGIMATLKFRVGRRLHSAALVADAWNDSVDILGAGAAMCGLLLAIHDPSRFLAADHYGGAVVGVFVTLTGLRVVRETSLPLLDTMPDQSLINDVRHAVAQVPGALGVEKCYARKTGLQYHVDLHLEVDPQLTVGAAHDIATLVREHVRLHVPLVADVLVHVEPFGMG